MYSEISASNQRRGRDIIIVFSRSFPPLGGQCIPWFYRACARVAQASFLTRVISRDGRRCR
jgi:hypothetical protein